MGEVWLASHRTLARAAAIKLIRPESLGDESGATSARFEREAQAIASLQSPNTIALYDFGSTDDGTLFYVMELLDGVDLEDLVQQHGPLPAERVVHILRQACTSLAEAHARAIIHRDYQTGQHLPLSTRLAARRREDPRFRPGEALGVRDGIG